ncbi:hypothetical protein KY358_02300 [Candidatus Woesearchaeota archaeon]|nr:hypothetical protein [Candidatus Woesearchaeota archaeon]
MANISKILTKILAVYSIIVVVIVSSIVLSGDNGHDKAVIKMGLGLIIIWVIIGGTIMFKLKERIRKAVLKIPLSWKIKFIVFATFLALVEEAITTTMTNLAPVFGSRIGEAYITVSANYLHVVLFHSVIAFLGMFIVWSLLLSKYDFSPNSVFLLFGLTGTIAEISINPTAIISGFWFFVYGLMVYLPAYSLPKERQAKKPKFFSYIIAILSPLVLGGILVGIANMIRINLGIPFFID